MLHEGWPGVLNTDGLHDNLATPGGLTTAVTTYPGAREVTLTSAYITYQN